MNVLWGIKAKLCFLDLVKLEAIERRVGYGKRRKVTVGMRAWDDEKRELTFFALNITGVKTSYRIDILLGLVLPVNSGCKRTSL